MNDENTTEQVQVDGNAEHSSETETLSSRLIDSDFRAGYAWGYRLALADMLERCQFLLKHSAALTDLRNHAIMLAQQVSEEVAAADLPNPEVEP